MERLGKTEFKEMLRAACAEVVENEQYLCGLDRFVGDGDHGITAARGFGAVRRRLGTEEYESISQMLEQTAEILEESMGGAIGPIFGSIFEGAGEAVRGKAELDVTDFARMLKSGLAYVTEIGGAKLGDRTLVDCLAPAAEAMEKHAADGLEAALCTAARQAEKGTEATKYMEAKKGRAKFLGEKSVGHQDAGATTMLLIIQTFAGYCAGFGKS